MKHCLVFLALFLWLPAHAGSNWIAFSQKNLAQPELSVSTANVHTMTLKIALPGVWHNQTKQKGMSYDEIIVPGLEPSLKADYPATQSIGYLVHLLNGTNFSAKVVSAKEQVINDVRLMPAKRFPNRCSTAEPTMEENKEAYSQNAFYPGELVTTESLGWLRNIPLGRVVINPIQYNPVLRQVKIYTEMTVELSFNGQLPKGFSRAGENSPAFYQFANSVVINHFGLPKLDNPEVMLVISADDFMTNSRSLLPEFIREKEMLGIRVVAKTTSEIGTTPDAIKNFIQNAYDTWAIAPTYLLLVGNENTMPFFRRSTSSGQAASDYVYSLLKGNDILPDLFYGRIVADNLDEANVHLRKIMDYEWHPESGADWYTKAVGIASREGSNPSDEEYIGQIEGYLLPHYTLVNKFFQKAGTATKANINSALNEGRSWLTYIGHGSGTSWGSTNDSYSNSAILELRNNNRLPMVVDVACMNAQFDKTQKSFGEQWVQAAESGQATGAVAYWGGTVSISWHPPAIMARGIAMQHFALPVYGLGASLIAGQLYLVSQSGTGSDVEDNFEWYALFGDPSMLIRTASPQELTLSGPDVIGLGQTSYSGSFGASDVKVVLYEVGKGVIGITKTDAAGNFNLDFTPFAGPTNVVVIGYRYNAAPTYKQIQVIPLAGAYVLLDKVAITAENGIADGRPNPGETLSYQLTFKNVGLEASQPGTFEITGANPFVQAFTQQVQLGAVEPGQTAQAIFTLTMLPNLPNSSSIDFAVRIPGQEAAATFTLVSAAPEVKFVKATLISDANGNQYLDPGEQGKIRVTLKNIGAIDATSVVRNLISQNEAVTIGQAIMIDKIEAGKESSIDIDVFAAASAQMGTLAAFNFDNGDGSIVNDVLKLRLGAPVTQLFSYEGEPITIKDKALTLSKLTLPAASITNIRLWLDMTHTYMADLVIKLIDAKGTTVVIRDRVGLTGGTIQQWIPDQFTPKEPLSKLFGDVNAGEWTLSIEDVAPRDEGVLKNWKLEIAGYY